MREIDLQLRLVGLGLIYHILFYRASTFIISLLRPVPLLVLLLFVPYPLFHFPSLLPIPSSLSLLSLGFLFHFPFGSGFPWSINSLSTLDH